MAEAAKKMITRVALIFIAEMIADDVSGERIQNAVISFRAPTFFANGSNPLEIDRLVRSSFRSQITHLEEFMRSGSNWRFNRALAFDVEVSAVNPVRGGCQTLSMRNWDNGKHIFNPPSTKNQCFLYCLAYFLLFGLVVKRSFSVLDLLPQLNKRVKSFNTKGIKFPIAVQDIKRFLVKNPSLNLAVNVLYRSTTDEIYPLEFRLGGGDNVVTLLLVHAKSGGHFMLVTNTDLFLRKVYRNEKKRYKTSFFCLNCFSAFNSVGVRNKHEEICMVNKPRKEKTPEIGKNWVHFRRMERKHWLDYIAFMDFECVLPNAQERCSTCLTLKCKCDNSSNTKLINKQRPICFSFVVLDANDCIIHEHSYVGEEAHLEFMKHLLDEEDKWIAALMSEKRPMEMTFRNTMHFNNSIKCYICSLSFGEEVVKCRDHCHFTGKYLGAACQKCNLSRRQQNRLKIFIHNASKYDMHFLIQAIPQFKDKIKGLRILPYNGENFRTMTFNSFEILDSLSFLQASLSQLANDLKTAHHNYPIIKQTYLVRKHGEYKKSRLEMILAKSFFPYEYCTSHEKMKNTVSIPRRRKFFSLLAGKSITSQEHAFAKTVWKTFHCKNLLDYCKLYCKIDVLLLAEIFQKFRREMVLFSGLDPAHYISLPAYGYDSMLYITGAHIELPTCIDIVHFLERCKRGGVSFINTRYLSVLNEGAKGKETKREEIFYIDANNLYGNAQLQKLPVKDFRWLNDTERENFNFLQDTEGEKGYFVECDIQYPSHLHLKHSNFPLCPELLEVTYDNLSPYSKTALAKTDGKKKYADVKLMSTFHDKLNYVAHFKLLKLYIQLGLIVVRVHRILEFSQEHLLLPFIEKTTAARQKAESKFQSDLFKKLVIIPKQFQRALQRAHEIVRQMLTFGFGK